MKKQIRKYITASLLLFLLTATAARAQYEDLDPLMWVPLQIGNVWHYNFAGEIEMSISIISGDTTWQFNAAGLASGVYTVRLTTGEGPGTHHRIFLLR